MSTGSQPCAGPQMGPISLSKWLGRKKKCMTPPSRMGLLTRRGHHGPPSSAMALKPPWPLLFLSPLQLRHTPPFSPVSSPAGDHGCGAAPNRESFSTGEQALGQRGVPLPPAPPFRPVLPYPQALTLWQLAPTPLTTHYPHLCLYHGAGPPAQRRSLSFSPPYHIPKIQCSPPPPPPQRCLYVFDWVFLL